MRVLAALAALALLSAAPAPLLVDPMDDAAPWVAKGSDSVAASSVAVPGAAGQAIALRYDFAEVSGYAYMRRTADIAMPRNFEIRFKLKGSGVATNRLLRKYRTMPVVWNNAV